ncbi:MAG: flagellin [Roseomonas sp.]|jgi:flagellin|nr:flagellin [Roseomonas sp.]
MLFNSINTNAQSLIALQSLNITNDQLSTTQKRVSTGFRVSDARDDGGAFAVAQSVRSDVAGVVAVNEQLGGIKGILETTFAALSVVSDTMKQLRATLTRLADGAISSEQRTAYAEQYTFLAKQVASFVDDATYNGRTLLSTVSTAIPNGGNITAIRNEAGGLFTIEAVDGSALKLTATAPTNAAAAQTSINSGGAFDIAEAAISKALNQFGASMAFVDSQITYNSKKSDAMSNGLGALVDADLARESSTLEALKVRQQLGVQTLGLANQGPQVLLGLFR